MRWRDASRRTATAFDTPPLSVDGLRETIRNTRDSLAEVDVASVLPEVELRRLWGRIGAAAQRQGVSPFDVSGIVALGSLDRVGRFGSGALSSVRAAGSLLDRHVFDHYRTVLADMEERGFYPSLATASRPYAEAVWRNFAARSPDVDRGVPGDGRRRAHVAPGEGLAREAQPATGRVGATGRVWAMLGVAGESAASRLEFGSPSCPVTRPRNNPATATRGHLLAFLSARGFRIVAGGSVRPPAPRATDGG